MNKLLTALLVVFTLISCEKVENKSSDLFTFVPEGSSFVISTNNSSVFIAQIESSELFDKDEIKSKFNISALKEYIQLLEPSRSLIAFSKKDSLSYNYLVISKAKKDSLLLKNQPNFSVESISTKELDYKKISIDNNITYSAFIDNTILASSSKSLLIDAVNQSRPKNIRSESFNKAIAAASLDKTALFINHAVLETIADKKNMSANKLDKPIADWSVLDLDLGSQKMNFNGIAVS
ncbi:MAG TPA: hypothetical protein VK833_11045, partial [Gillisia sp.]|nr:hypothetical protein [Gillisia sp.]